FFSDRRRHTRSKRDWSSDVCSSDLTIHDSSVKTRSDTNWPTPSNSLYLRVSRIGIFKTTISTSSSINAFHSLRISSLFLPKRLKIGGASCREVMSEDAEPAGGRAEG